MANKTLEQKTEKIDWKECPVYGICKSIKNQNEDKPSVSNNVNSNWVNVVYYGISIGLVSTGLYILADRLF